MGFLFVGRLLNLRMLRFLSSLLLIYFVSGQSILKQESFRDSNIDIEENLIIGISKKRISLKKTPKRLSKKLDIVISIDDTVLIKEDQLFDNKKYIKVYTFNGETGWASRKHIKILEKKLEVITLKEEIEKEVDSLRFEQLSRKIEKKSIQLKNNKPDSKTIIENKNLSPENDKI